MSNKPVAWGMPRPDGQIMDVITPEEHARVEGAYTVPLFKEFVCSTGLCRYRKPLSDEEIVDLWADVSIDHDDQINIIEMARAIERAHGIGGEA